MISTERIQPKFLANPILYLSVKRLRYSVIASFGTDTIGLNEKKILNLTKSSGYRKLSAIYSVTKK